MSPYLIVGIGAGVLGIAIGAVGMHYTVDAAQLAKTNKALSIEQSARARDNEQGAINLKSVSDTAAAAASAALAKQTKMQQDNDAAQAQLSKLQGENNVLDSKYRVSLASGAQRVRVAVTNCTPTNSAASSSAMSGDTKPAGGQSDTASSAYLDPAVAERVFGVAADDQQQIDRYAKLQAWACTVKPDAPGCDR